MSTQENPDPISATFGANEWLIEELFEKYQQDPNLVDPAWWDFFKDYQPSNGNRSAATSAATSGAPSREAAGTDDRPQAVSHTPPPAAAERPQPPQAGTPARDAAVATSRPLTATPTPPPGIVEEPAPVATAKPAKATYVQRPASRQDVGEAATGEASTERLRGPAARVVTNMEASLQVPTATSVRAVPAKLLIDNRIVINNHMARSRGGKVSFTHLIGYAVVEALAHVPEMNYSYTEVDGKPGVSRPAHVNFALAIDLPKPDGTRQLLVPSIKAAEEMDFAQFRAAYEDLVRRARDNKLTVDDHMGGTITLTNPGTIGTVHSMPRLMVGQGTIVGVGALNYPAEYAGAAEETLAQAGVSKILTLTSTYDHRIIQGAASGEFLQVLEKKLLGEDGFYDRVFAALRIPYEPVRWQRDVYVDPDTEAAKPARIAEVINAYRTHGHLLADIDPLTYRQRRHPDLDITTHGLTLWDLERTFPTGGFAGTTRATLREILGTLRDSYCRTVGVEYMHIQDPAEREWLQERLEAPYQKLSVEEHLHVLNKLGQAEAFETFLQTKYVGQKRFSLEGGESLIPLLDTVLTGAARDGMEEVAIGMAHRGRLNVLANIAGKSYAQIFSEFEGNEDVESFQGSGDVKYHLGTVGTYTAPTGEQTGVYLAANPSHLEAVNGVLEGIVRAKQDRIDLGERGFSVLPVLVHGDAAFAGQGVVWEVLNMSQLRGYRTGGTVHVVVNNQIGYTTGPWNSRSTPYATDIAKGLQVPIFHVNGDDPEAVVRVAQLAFEYRQKFHKDVIIDMVCYRLRGHNEGDDPSMTQPVMYSLIDNKRSARKLYTESLVGRGDITEEQAHAALQNFHAELEKAFAETRETILPPEEPTVERVAGLELPASQHTDAGTMVGWQTAVAPEVLHRIGEVHTSPPADFTVHPKLERLLERRAKMAREGGIDWGFGELLAFGSLLMEGTPVRLAGQDSRRGTFVQRHAVFHDYNTGAEWTPLAYLTKDQAKLWVYDSSLSEYGAMAFEYGYSVERPDALVLWEAQFGDFVNGAQIVIDEFLSSSERKWGQRSSLVLLLPHGYEGQGPDHTSGRIERFLQLCAESNMVVAQPSTPANHFHLLRRQAYDRPRVPLIVFTPKQLLRLRAAASAVEDFTTGGFQTVIGDSGATGRVERVLLCSGRVYYDLAAHREKQQATNTAIVRLEQLYPLDHEAIRAELDRFPGAELVWVQDEPANQGPWTYVSDHLGSQTLGGRELRLVSRPEAASPATGHSHVHKMEQEQLIHRAFN